MRHRRIALRSSREFVLNLMRFRTVLIDLDGTLIDHLHAIHRCYCHTLPKLGYQAPTYEQVKRAIGGGLENAMLRFVPQARLQEALSIFRPYWDATMLEDVELMRGGRELLEFLKRNGISCAVFTNKHGPSSRAVCEHLGVTPLLSGIFGATDTSWLKPQREFAEHVLKTLGAEASSTLMIGDSPFDVAAAKNAPLAASWCVTTGTHGAEELEKAGADRIFADLNEIRVAMEFIVGS